MLAAAYGWTPDVIERLTFEQAELFVQLARDEQEIDATMKANAMSDVVLAIFKATGLVQ